MKWRINNKTKQNMVKNNEQNETKTYLLNRTGQPPLKFTGTKIANESSEYGPNGRANRWSVVDIYQTRGGKFIAHVSSYTIWQGESDYFKGGSFTTPQEVIEFLKDEGGHLGRVSQGAIEEASKNCEAFKSAFVEEVE